jgi:hypothetical protein
MIPMVGYQHDSVVRLFVARSGLIVGIGLFVYCLRPARVVESAWTDVTTCSVISRILISVHCHHCDKYRKNGRRRRAKVNQPCYDSHNQKASLM